jgi:hypothetical protein
LLTSMLARYSSSHALIVTRVPPVAWWSSSSAAPHGPPCATSRGVATPDERCRADRAIEHDHDRIHAVPVVPPWLPSRRGSAPVIRLARIRARRGGGDEDGTGARCGRRRFSRPHRRPDAGVAGQRGALARLRRSIPSWTGSTPRSVRRPTSASSTHGAAIRTTTIRQPWRGAICAARYSGRP